jgi:hypothetical protein
MRQTLLALLAALVWLSASPVLAHPIVTIDFEDGVGDACQPPFGVLCSYSEDGYTVTALGDPPFHAHAWQMTVPTFEFEFRDDTGLGLALWTDFNDGIRVSRDDGALFSLLEIEIPSSHFSFTFVSPTGASVEASGFDPDILRFGGGWRHIPYFDLVFEAEDGGRMLVDNIRLLSVPVPPTLLIVAVVLVLAGVIRFRHSARRLSRSVPTTRWPLVLAFCVGMLGQSEAALLTEFQGGGGGGGGSRPPEDVASVSFGLFFGTLPPLADFPFPAAICLGCSLVLSVGQTGTFDFPASEFPELIDRLTDGVDDHLQSTVFLLDADGVFVGGVGSGAPESLRLGGMPDLSGREIDQISVTIHSLTVGPGCCLDPTGTPAGLSWSADVTWQFFGSGAPIQRVSAPASLTLLWLGFAIGAVADWRRRYRRRQHPSKH